jgi:hypothetical protein
MPHNRFDWSGRIKAAERECTIPDDVTEETQSVRIHRNNLVHRRIDDHATAITFADSRGRLLTYLSELPETWG